MPNDYPCTCKLEVQPLSFGHDRACPQYRAPYAPPVLRPLGQARLPERSSEGDKPRGP